MLPVASDARGRTRAGPRVRTHWNRLLHTTSQLIVKPGWVAKALSITTFAR